MSSCDLIYKLKTKLDKIFPVVYEIPKGKFY